MEDAVRAGQQQMNEESQLQFEGEVSLPTLTAREMCRSKCGHPGIFLV